MSEQIFVTSFELLSMIIYYGVAAVLSIFYMNFIIKNGNIFLKIGLDEKISKFLYKWSFMFYLANSIFVTFFTVFITIVSIPIFISKNYYLLNTTNGAISMLVISISLAFSVLINKQYFKFAQDEFFLKRGKNND